jgi:hypothetical protein
MSEADAFLEDVTDAGGRLEFPEGRGVRDKYAKIVAQSLKSSRRSFGKKLELKSAGSWGSGPVVAAFVDRFHDLVTAPTVLVPERVSKYHPIIKAYTQDKDWQNVISEHVNPAARILQAVADEVLRRDMRVLSHTEAWKQHAQTDDRRTLPDGVFYIAASARLYAVKIKEITGQGGQKKAPAAWDARSRGPLWLERRAWEFVSSGRLEVPLDGPRAPYKEGALGDAKTLKLEDRLPELFRAINIYALRLNAREAERERELAICRERWEQAMARARQQFDSEARYGRFRELSDRWETVNRRRAFLTAVRERLLTYEDDDRAAVEAQLDFAQYQIVERDPLRDLSKLVVLIPEPKPDDLKPFLGGWSPYGPEVR